MAVHLLRSGIEIWAYKAWQGNDYYAGWHNSCTQVLPELNEDYTCELNSLEDVIYYLADEHTTVLTNFAPVAIEFVPEHDPAIEAELSAEYAEEHRKSEELRKEFEELRTRQEQEEALRRQQHPRSDDWQALSAEELQRLVWTKSILQLSEEFGKSDVAIKSDVRSWVFRHRHAGFGRRSITVRFRIRMVYRWTMLKREASKASQQILLTQEIALAMTESVPILLLLEHVPR